MAGLQIYVHVVIAIRKWKGVSLWYIENIVEWEFQVPITKLCFTGVYERQIEITYITHNTCI